MWYYSAISGVLDRHAGADVLLFAALAVTRFRFLPSELDAVSFVPFCALIGGMTGAARHVVFYGFEKFPKRESFRGAFLGVLFGLFFIGFGVYDH